MRFEQSDYLLALGALPALAWLFYVSFRRADRRLALLFDSRIWPDVLPPRRNGRGRAPIWTAACALILLALARPQWGYRWQETPERGMNIVIALDTSNSMRAEDVKPSRFQRAQWAIRDLTNRLPGDRVGLIAFAGSAFAQCPLTSDRAAFWMTLDDASPGIVPRGGTAFAPALRKALAMLEPESDADGALILFSDGEDLEGGWEAPLEELRRRHVRIYTVGIGTDSGGLVPAPESGPDARAGWIRDRAGHPVLSRLREDALERMALTTGGLYIRASATDFGIDRILDELRKLRRSELAVRRVRIPREQAGWFIAVALGLLLLDAAWSGCRILNRHDTGREASR